MSIIRFLLEAEAKPLAQAGLDAVAVPAKRATGRIAWGVGLALAALILLAVAIGLGTVALAAFVLDAMPASIEPLALSAGSLCVIAAVLGLISARLFAAISAKRMVQDAEHAYRDTRLSQPPLGAAAKSAQDHMVVNSYAFARGFASGLSNGFASGSRAS
jgi:hypothetical protein